jgi:flagellar biosynthesis chaperone FliJ
MDKLDQRLQSSISTSEELRRRLAMLSCYYENLVKKLQEEVAEERVDRQKLESDLTRQIAELENEKRALYKKLQEHVRSHKSYMQSLRRKR